MGQETYRFDFYRTFPHHEAEEKGVGTNVSSTEI